MDGSKNSFKALTKAVFLAKKCNSSITALYVLRTAFDNPNLIYVHQTQNELKSGEIPRYCKKTGDKKLCQIQKGNCVRT